MAKHQYKPGYRVEKPCRHCGKVMSLMPSWAEKKVYCSKECRAAKVYKTCQECGDHFVLHRSRAELQSFCSRSCSSKQKALRRGQKVKAMQAFCQNCGLSFRPNVRSQNVGKYCGRACAYAHKSKGAEIVRWIYSLGAENRERRKAWEIANRPVFVFQGPVRPISGVGSIGTCRQCKTEYVRASDRQSICSSDCQEIVDARAAKAEKDSRRRQRKTPYGRAYKKLYKTLRRKRELKVYEAVDPFEIFARDKWVCQLCGDRTPKSLRGTCEPNAPELDHIIPLALDGSHTRDNLQCACRSCNQRKGAKPLGQLGLSLRRTGGSIASSV